MTAMSTRARTPQLIVVTIAGAISVVVHADVPATQPAASNYVQQAVKDLDLTPQLLSGAQLDDGAGASGQDPLKSMSEQMAVIRDNLTQFQTDKPVQDKQAHVITDLNTLIAALEKHTGSGSGNKPSGQGRKRSGIFSGDPAYGDLHGVNNEGRQWGQLPPKQREEILQSRTEGFPPGYETLLQSYYQQLSQEKTADDKPSNSSSPATAPANP